AAEDQTALLKAKYAVRRAELEVSKNELVSPIDAQKNLLALDEAKRALAQLQQDIQSHSASNQAALAISEEKRHKARHSMEQAEQNIKNMHITSPIDGLVVIHGNRDSTGGFFMWGMTLPDYHVGDQVNPGCSIAEVIDMSHLDVSAQVGETDRINLKAGQSVEMQEVKVRAVSEGRAILSGISPGTVVALVNPEKRAAANNKNSGTSNPSLGPTSK